MSAASPIIKLGDSRHALLGRVTRIDPLMRIGRVAEAYGTLIRVTGIRAAIGDLCELRDAAGSDLIRAEVVGVSGSHTLLTPLGSLSGVSSATQVVSLGRRATVAVGQELRGRVIDALGQPIDGKGAFAVDAEVPVYRDAPNPLSRRPIDTPLASGVRAIDSLLTVGTGQRVGIFAVAGGGKSTLMGMLARGAAADVNVITLVGERGRELNEFIIDSLGEEGLRRSIVVVATSDRPPLERSRAAYLGTAIAEYFRDQGLNVLLMMDSVTRYARALRDVGLALGEPPARRGFPPSVFSELPRLFERAGNNDRGSITAFYTVLQEDEDGTDPIAEEVRSILDGHIYLSRKLASAYHYPAIDVLGSASRVMPRVAGSDHQRRAGLFRKYYAKYHEIELLLQLGEYKAGSDADADLAIARIADMRRLLQQPQEQLVGFDDTMKQLERLFP